MSNKEATEAILSEAADVIEQTLDEIEKVQAVIEYKTDPFIVAGAAIIGLSVGAFVGYRLAKRYLEPKYAAIAEDEIRTAKAMYAHINKDGFESPTIAVDKLIPDTSPEAQAAMRKYQGKDVHVTVVEDGVLVSRREDQTENLVEPEPTPEPKQENVFTAPAPIISHPGWDHDVEVSRRSKNRPYVVTQEEYFENDLNLECISVTYYEGDEVLSDSSDGIISDIDGTIGKENLQRFGVGSNEEHIVYVFNEKAGMGFEVARSEGRYAVEVLGFDDEDASERMPRRGRRLGD